MERVESAVTSTFDPDALRQRTGRNATSDCARTATSSTGRSSARSPTTSTTRTSIRWSGSRCSTRSTWSSSAAGSAACWPGPACRRPASTTSASSRRAATSAARGTGTATRARRATSSRTSTSRCWRRSGTSRGEVLQGARDPRAQPGHRPRTSTCTTARCFQTEVTELRWDEDAGVGWSRRATGDELRARFVCMANGRCTGPSCRGSTGSRRSPGTRSTPAAGTTPTPAVIPRRAWTGCAGKRVGIIGTGATAVQCVPHVGAAAEHLYVFQRTPSSIDVRANRPTDPEWAANLEPGWQQRRMENFNNLVTGVPRGRGPRRRRVDGHHRQAAAACCATPTSTDLSPEGVASARRAGRLREDGVDPGARRHHRQRPGDGRRAQAVLPAVLQAAVLPRRVPRHLQPSERDARRHGRSWRRPHHRDAASSSARPSSSSTA